LSFQISGFCPNFFKWSYLFRKKRSAQPISIRNRFRGHLLREKKFTSEMRILSFWMDEKITKFCPQKAISFFGTKLFLTFKNGERALLSVSKVNQYLKAKYARKNSQFFSLAINFLIIYSIVPRSLSKRPWLFSRWNFFLKKTSRFFDPSQVSLSSKNNR